ncbi:MULTISPECIES: DUF2703 domain-containing protein [Burkholderia]|uniref:DUF2703 domain-containing protein n=1 Tax=Burkholderia multivorans (strain ATCC 17616 / 249) TaxID=395019 RepID=A0A0H3KYZ4_BURM1|nr:MULTISPECIES: DUF2703 domain-containing protein [Burkholderia]ABX19333.1 conserved hypothetical protein [Burkholderia multivorans ATCC 17616]AIO71096.1 hypothetical protein DM80_6057 [Burkholderia multivorans]KVE20127.1 heavy metal sensor signal transduction histidine kinase [Burkholderia vietnamiensis]MBR7913771.1 DUF2703 domain-containing protein [Burkholderia vietnamiensis]MBU9146366.1 DUF2703 domain-containing protein [Burkholderia multivorans]
MKALPILWQRLVTSGKTCPRCADTGEEVNRAIRQLREILLPLGIEPVLERREIDEATFKATPAESNRIWIAGKPMEAWLNGTVGSSRCCSVCGDTECRTVEVEGASYEVIPEALLVKAGLIAALTLNAQGSKQDPS